MSEKEDGIEVIKVSDIELRIAVLEVRIKLLEHDKDCSVCELDKNEFKIRIDELRRLIGD